MKKYILSLILFSFLICVEGTSQLYNSAMGVRVSTNISDGTGVQWSGKIYVNNKAALTGFVGFMSKEPNTAAGAGITYQHHFPLLDIDNLHSFVGAGVKGFIGDIRGTGWGPIVGVTKLFGNKWNVELDIFPTYLIGAEDNMTGEKISYDVQIGLIFRYASK